MAVTTAAPLRAPGRAEPTAPAARLDAHELIRRWRLTGDPRWRDRAVEAYMPLARRIAKRYSNGPDSLEDLSQVAYLGLVKAVERFDPEAGSRFGSFAVPTISGELRRHFRDTGWAVHVPRGLQEDVLRVRTASVELTDQLGRSPTVSELSEATGLDSEQVVETLQATGARDAKSLDQQLPGSDDDDSTSLGDTLGSTDDGFDLADNRATISPLLRTLPSRDREMLHMRFAQDMTQTEIAERLGCSQMQVSRLLRRALDQLGALAREPTGTS